MTAENYCANCGQKVKHYSYGGIYCWTEKTAEKEWQKMLKEKAEAIGKDECLSRD